jgi:hypothetical protein
MESTYSADGPDGSDPGYSRFGLPWVIEGRWDGGEDNDPTVIPGPEFDVFVTCAPNKCSYDDVVRQAQPMAAAS